MLNFPISLNVVFLNSKDANLKFTLQEMWIMKNKQLFVSDNSLTIVNKVLAEAKKHYNKELEQKIKFIFHTDDSTSYKVVRRLANACKKSKKTRTYLTSCKFTFTNTTATAVRTAAEEYCFAACNNPLDECPSCNMFFTLTSHKDVLATLSYKNAVDLRSSELPPSLLSKEIEAWATANSIPTRILVPSSSIVNYKKVILQGSDPKLSQIIGGLNTANFEGTVFILGATNGSIIPNLINPFEMYQVKSGSKYNAASNQYTGLSNYNYDKSLVAAIATMQPQLQSDCVFHSGSGGRDRCCYSDGSCREIDNS